MNYLPEDQDLPPLDVKKLGRPPGSFKKKMNKSEQRGFMSESINIILREHLSHREYVLWCEKEHALSKAQANQYWVSAWATLKKKFAHDKDKLIMKHIAQYYDIHQEALNKGDLTNARGVLNDIAKLMGLNAEEKIQVNHQVIRLNFGGDEPLLNEGEQ